MDGWTGKMLDVDLTTGRIRLLDSTALTERFLGGSGLGQAVIWDQVPPGTGALAPENVVVLTAGPLAGTAAPASARLSIDTMNALTGGVNFSSASGHFAPEIKFAGLDAINLRGSTDRPVCLRVADGEARILDARHLWGKTTGEAEDRIRRDMGDRRARVISLGPAGENLVRAACVIVDRARAAGRGGVGPVFGSKNLKAVAVRGTQPVNVARPAAFMAEVDRALAKLEYEQTRKLRRYGTFLSMPTMNSLSRVPFRNSQDDHMDEARLAAVAPDVFVRDYWVRKLPCFNCPAVCSNFLAVREGEYAGTAGGGFHQNHMENYASRSDMNDPAAVIYLQSLCSDLGLDIDNSSVALAWAFECYEQEILSVRDTGGLELRWGEHRTIAVLLRQLAYRQGLGALLAEGVREESRQLGPEAERLAPHLKGQELHDTVRAAKGWGFGVVVSTRVGTHLEGAPTTERWNRPPEYFLARIGHPSAGDPTTLDGKPEVVFWYECFKELVDSLGICYLVSAWHGTDNLWPDDLAALMSAASGREFTGDELLAVNRRIFNLKKAFNALHRGFTRDDDMPPARLMEEPVGSGPGKGARLDPDEWNRALDRYYTLHGRDVATGWQTAEGLNALGMNDVAERLAAAGRLRP